MAGRPDGQNEAGPEQAGAKPAHNLRRKLLRGGLSAAPVVMTLGSGPVLAGKVKTASTTASTPLSGTSSAQYTCNGRSPTSWCTKQYNKYVGWPSSCVPGTTTYHGSYRVQVRGSQCGTKKHTDIMNSYCGLNGYEWRRDTGSLNKLAAHCAASLLNVEVGLIDERVLTKDKIQEIWDACSVGNGTGSWQPIPGVYWSANDVCNWMATTWS